MRDVEGMLRLAVASIAVTMVSAVMSMTGRGGGNFYVLILVACGASMHHAATTGQGILFLTAIVASLVFQKHRVIDWKLALVIDPPTNAMAFIGGYYAHLLSGGMLKAVFAGFLALAAFLMLRPLKDRSFRDSKRFGFWRREFGGHVYVVNLWLVLPITAATGLIAGMVGVSGGSFKVPLMVLACGVPMRVAVGTSSAMVAATALMGFIGHMAAGDFSASWVIPMSVGAVVGGLLGGRFSLKTRPENLKKIFAYTTGIAAVFMGANAWMSIRD
jgi:uncharacterized membrane protein YfcA